MTLTRTTLAIKLRGMSLNTGQTSMVIVPRAEKWHRSDVIMRAMASQITGVSRVCSIVCSGADQRKHQSSAPLAFVRGIHRSPVNSPHKGPVTQKMSSFVDFIMGLILVSFIDIWHDLVETLQMQFSHPFISVNIFAFLCKLHWYWTFPKLIVIILTWNCTRTKEEVKWT